MNPNEQQLQTIRDLVALITADVMGHSVSFHVARDVKQPEDGRIFIQCSYEAKCTVTNKMKTWKGRKWYLSDHMTQDEVVKTAYAAFKATVEHEVMEGFLFEGRRVFNPHVSFRALLAVSGQEVYRLNQAQP